MFSWLVVDLIFRGRGFILIRTVYPRHVRRYSSCTTRPDSATRCRRSRYIPARAAPANCTRRIRSRYTWRADASPYAQDTDDHLRCQTEARICPTVASLEWREREVQIVSKPGPGGAITDRVRIRMPYAAESEHCFEHGPQSDQLETTQSLTHGTTHGSSIIGFSSA